MLDIDVNAMIWGIFMSATMNAAVHLGQGHQENLRTTKNTDFEEAEPLCDISQKLILNQSEELFGISTIHWNTTPWMRVKGRVMSVSPVFIDVVVVMTLHFGIVLASSGVDTL